MKRALILSAFILAACAPIDASGQTAPAVRAGIANGNSTATVEARNDAQISIALTAIPPAQTSTAFAVEALSRAATLEAGDATRTQVADDGRATDRAATPTEAARLTATQKPIDDARTQVAFAAWVDSITATATAQAGAYQRQADDARFWGNFWKASAVGLMLVLLLVIIFIGGAYAARIEAEPRGKKYSHERLADAVYALRDYQGQAALVVANRGGAVGQQRAAIPPPPAEELTPEVKSAIDALTACADVVGPSSRLLPKADELSGPVRAALDPLKGNGLIQVQRGRNGGLYLSRHLTLGDLIDELRAGYIPLPPLAIDEQKIGA